MENTSEKLSIENSDDEMSFRPEENKGYRMIDLSMAVSSAHVCDEGEKFLYCCYKVLTNFCR